MVTLAFIVIAVLSLALVASCLLTWWAVYSVDLGAVDRSRKASRTSMVEAAMMLRSGVNPRRVMTFLDAAIEATALQGDALPVAG